MKRFSGTGLCLTVVLITALITVYAPVCAAIGPGDDAGARISKALVLYNGSPLAYANNARIQIEPADRDVFPYVQDSTPMVPLRFVAERLGARVGWDGRSVSVTLAAGRKKITLSPGNRQMTVDGTALLLDVPPRVVRGKTFMPAGPLAEALGKQLFYYFGLIIFSDQKDIINPEKEELLAHRITMLFDEGFDNSGSDGSDLDYSIVSDDPAVRVIIRHFDAINEKNILKYRTTVSSRFVHTNPDWGDIFRVKLVSIDEDKATITKDDYLSKGYGQISKPYEVRIFSVQQEIHRIRETFGVGWYSEPVWNYVVVRETPGGPWVIDDWGH